MHDPLFYLSMAAAGLAALLIIAMTALRGWNGWLDLKRAEMARRESPASAAGARIELAALRDRIRKLEAIAAGIDI